MRSPSSGDREPAWTTDHGTIGYHGLVRNLGGGCLTLLVHIEGVSFEETVSDVNDLATQRGASLALLEAPKVLIRCAEARLGAKVDEVFTGASIGRYLLQTDKTAVEVESLLRDIAVHPVAGTGALEPILPYLRFVVAAVDPEECGGDMATARRIVVAKARRAQLQEPTVAAPSPAGHTRLCALNPMLPAASCDEPYSASIEARREYGRWRKQSFYEDLYVRLPEGDVFARQMDDLVREPAGHVAETVRNKVAHIYLDGNDFTRIRERMIAEAESPLEAESEFAVFVSARRRDLLQRLIDDLGGCDDMFVAAGDEGRVFRWETLLWGGDEAAFVAPAWTLPRLLKLLAEELARGWTFRGTTLTHKCGIHVGDRKTPIALARRLAEALADASKRKDSNTVQIMVSESIGPPVDVTRIDPDTLREYRERLYGAGDPEHFTLDLGQVDTFVQGLRTVQDMPGGLPRSQLYGVLRGSVDPKTAFERSGATCAHVFEHPIFGAGATPLLPFRRVAELLDYFPLEAA